MLSCPQQKCYFSFALTFLIWFCYYLFLIFNLVFNHFFVIFHTFFVKYLLTYLHIINVINLTKTWTILQLLSWIFQLHYRTSILKNKFQWLLQRVVRIFILRELQGVILISSTFSVNFSVNQFKLFSHFFQAALLRFLLVIPNSDLYNHANFKEVVNYRDAFQ